MSTDIDVEVRDRWEAFIDRSGYVAQRAVQGGMEMMMLLPPHIRECLISGKIEIVREWLNDAEVLNIYQAAATKMRDREQPQKGHGVRQAKAGGRQK